MAIMMILIEFGIYIYIYIYCCRYLKVSISIMILMSINVFYPHITNLLFWRPLRLFKRKYFYKSRALQMDLNALYEGAEFDVGYRYALLCANIYLCFFFAPGIPLLYFLMFLQIILIYWIDKYLRNTI